MKLSTEVYIKKNTLEISGEFTNSNTSPFLTVSTNLTMTADEYVGFYIKITSGDSAGLISWITGNDTTKIDLETGIPVANGDDFEIYRSEYQRLDLFQDEKISITSQIGNANDIGKLYTDYTQSFTIPASKTNNQILSHWYESSVDNGFDHRMRYDAFIEVNTHRFKDGTIQLEKADKKDGFIESYTVTFYGNLVQLKDIIKDEKLQSLDFSSFNHTYDSNEVRNRITFSNITPILVRYPLIGNANKYEYQTGSPTDITTIAGAIKWNDLFPAITVKNIFAKIQAKYGVNFTGSFFNLKQWTELYLYLKPSLKMEYLSEPQQLNFTSIVTTSPNVAFPELNLTTDTLTTNWNFLTSISDFYQYYQIEILITPNSISQTIPYVLYTYKDGILLSSITQTGTRTIRIERVVRQNDPTANHRYTFKLSTTSAPFTYTASLLYTRAKYDLSLPPGTGSNFVYTYSRANTSSNTASAFINIANYMPDIKIIDFITGIIKAFNLMIIPRPNNTYEFAPLEMYYNAGKILDITEYTYEDEMSINKPKLFKSINFTYEESNNILNQAYKGLFQQNYGDLIYNSERITENSTYDIKLPFENVLFEVPTQGKLFQTATLIDKNRSPYIPKPMLIYMNQRVSGLTGTDQIYVTNTTGAATQINAYNRFSNEYDSMPTDATHSQLMTMNFGNEQSSWLNQLAPQGLYFRHYKNYIDNLYNIKTRLVKTKALLPPSLLGSTVTNGAGIPLGIALNDRLVIRNKRYIINSFTTDLTTGETDLELLTDYRGVNAASTVGYRFASMDIIQTDKEELIFDLEIYLNDYDNFGVKGPSGFLIYDDPTNNTSDINLTVTVPENTTGLDRTELIIIEYVKNGASTKLENIIVTQTGI
jgi:hypothetical protein